MHVMLKRSEFGGAIATGDAQACPGCGETGAVLTVETAATRDDELHYVVCTRDGHAYLVGVGGLVLTTAAERKIRLDVMANTATSPKARA
jgi:hypothetical protein